MDQQIIARPREEEAEKYGVHPNIHPQDFLFQYMSKEGHADTLKEYLANGRRSADKLRNLLYGQLSLADKPFSLLDFASGYGMVARHYPSVFSPKISITTCDIHPDANAFNARHIGVKTFQSTDLPEHLDFKRTFDVIFCLSFFSHMSHDYFARWLNKLYEFVNPGGFLIFTTHGRFSPIPSPNVLKDDIILFGTNSEQHDLSGTLYGSSWVSSTYVIKLLNQVDPRGAGKSRIVFFSEAYWWEHQDIYIVTKI